MDRMWKTFVCWWLGLLLSGPFYAGASTKRAVVIGLGEYEDASWGKINGDRDVPLIVGMLREVGYQDIVTMVNRTATKARIVAAFRQLVDRCGKGDIVYIHFSGHGQRMTDMDGDEPDDGWDESWIPYDAYLRYGVHDRGEKHLSDDEVAQWMEQVRRKIGRSGQLMLVVDACHSGDSTRGEETAAVRGVMQQFVIPGTWTDKCARRKEDWLTLSACKDYQRNSEVNTSKGSYGMLSYALVTLFRQWKGRDNAKVMQSLQQFVNVYRGPLPQSPELTGNKRKYQITHTFFDR